MNEISWTIKRIALNVIWFAINLAVMILGTIAMKTYLPDFMLLWYSAWFIYGWYYRIIATEIFDALISDGMNY